MVDQRVGGADRRAVTVRHQVSGGAVGDVEHDSLAVGAAGNLGVAQSQPGRRAAGPRLVRFGDELPKTSTGKIKRRELIKQLDS